MGRKPRESRAQREAREAREAMLARKLIGYIRVSTEEQSAHGHSLQAQEHRLREVAEREGYEVIDVLCDVASGGKRDRVGLDTARARIDSGEAGGLVYVKLDRVTRSLLQGAEIVEWAKTGGHTLLSADEGLQVHRGELAQTALPFLLAMAQVEKDRIRERTLAGLQAARRKGIRLGRPPENVGKLAERALELREKGYSYDAIAIHFNGEGHRTARGAEFKAMTVSRMVERLCPNALRAAVAA